MIATGNELKCKGDILYKEFPSRGKAMAGQAFEVSAFLRAGRLERRLPLEGARALSISGVSFCR